MVVVVTTLLWIKRVGKNARKESIDNNYKSKESDDKMTKMERKR